MKNPTFIHSLKHAIDGLILANKTEKNLRFHWIASIGVLFAAFQLEFNQYEWVLIILSIGAVITVEMINTAIEYTVDLISPTINPKAKLIKDISAGSVLIASASAGIVGIILFTPKIIAFFNT